MSIDNVRKILRVLEHPEGRPLTPGEVRSCLMAYERGEDAFYGWLGETCAEEFKIIEALQPML